MMIGEVMGVLAGMIALSVVVLVSLYLMIQAIKEEYYMYFILFLIIFLSFGGLLMVIVETMWRSVV